MATDKYNCSENLWSKILLSARIILFYPGLFGTVIYLIYAILYTQRDGHHFFYFYSFQKWWPSQHSSLFNFSSSSFFRIKFISIPCKQIFLFQILSSFLFPAHKRLIYVSISFRLFRKFYRSEIIFYDVWFPVYLKNFGGYTFSCSLNNSGLNFLNSKPFVISVLCDLLIQIDLLGFSPLQFFKVSWKKVPARFFYF